MKTKYLIGIIVLIGGILAACERIIMMHRMVDCMG